MPIPQGPCIISNVAFLRCLTLPLADTSDKSCGIEASLEDSLPGSKWHIIPQVGSEYLIQNCRDGMTFAWCRYPSREDDSVKAHSANRTTWIIKETLTTGQYTISPSGNEDLFWGLENVHEGALVELKQGETLLKNHWEFKTSDLIVDVIINALRLDFHWLDTTSNPYRGHVSGTLEGHDVPSDAIISFPKRVTASCIDGLVATTVVLPDFYKHHRVNDHEANAMISPFQPHQTKQFAEHIFEREEVSVELFVNEVTVTAGGKTYKNIKTSFRKFCKMKGFNGLCNQIQVGTIKVTGSDDSGTGLTAACLVEITNPTNFTINIGDTPIDVNFRNTKIAKLTLPGFTFHRHTLGQLLRMDVDLIFNPENPRDPNCQDFIADFITSGKSLAVSLTVRDIVICLAGFSITMNPRRKVDTTVLGINARFVKFIRLYPSVFGVLFGNNCNFSFNFENPVDTKVTILHIQGTINERGRALGSFDHKLNMPVPARDIAWSPYLAGHVLLPISHIIFQKIGNVVDLHVTHATIRIGSFVLPHLEFNIKDVPIETEINI